MFWHYVYLKIYTDVFISGFVLFLQQSWDCETTPTFPLCNVNVGYHFGGITQLSEDRKPLLSSCFFICWWHSKWPSLINIGEWPHGESSSFVRRNLFQKAVLTWGVSIFSRFQKNPHMQVLLVGDFFPTF